MRIKWVNTCKTHNNSKQVLIIISRYEALLSFRVTLCKLEKALLWVDEPGKGNPSKSGVSNPRAVDLYWSVAC